MNGTNFSILLLTPHAVTEPTRFAAWLGALLESTTTTPTHWKSGRNITTSFDPEAVQATVSESRAAGRIEMVYLYRKRLPKYELGFSCPDSGLRFVTLNFEGIPAAEHLPEVFAAADRLAATLGTEFGYADFPWDNREYGPLFPGVMTWKTLNRLGPTLGYRRTYLGPHARRLAKSTLVPPPGTTATELGGILRVDLLVPPWAGTAAELSAARLTLMEANDSLGLFRRRSANGTVVSGPAWTPAVNL